MTTEESVIDELVEDSITEEEGTLDGAGDEITGADATAQSQEYTPSYKYKVLDEEKEFDTRLHGIIKSKDDEEFLRDLYTRADGLENYKQKLSMRDTEFDTYRNQMAPVVEGFKKLKAARDSGKLQDLFYDLGLDEDTVLQYALSIASERELPEQQRVAVQQNRDYERKVSELESRLSSYEESIQQERIAAQVNDLSALVSNDSVKDIREALQSSGNDLRDTVIKYGVGIYQTTGKEPTVQEAFNAVVNQYRALMPRVDKQQTTQIVQQKTLPRVKGEGGMKQAQKVLTLADLQKMADAIPN